VGSWVGGDPASKINLNGLEPKTFDLLLLNFAWVQFNLLGMAIDGIGQVISGLGRQPAQASPNMTGGVLFGKLQGGKGSRRSGSWSRFLYLPRGRVNCGLGAVL
jgi:hypothetical protein